MSNSLLFKKQYSFSIQNHLIRRLASNTGLNLCKSDHENTENTFFLSPTMHWQHISVLLQAQ